MKFRENGTFFTHICCYFKALLTHREYSSDHASKGTYKALKTFSFLEMHNCYDKSVIYNSQHSAWIMWIFMQWCHEEIKTGVIFASLWMCS